MGGSLMRLYMRSESRKASATVEHMRTGTRYLATAASAHELAGLGRKSPDLTWLGWASGIRLEKCPVAS